MNRESNKCVHCGADCGNHPLIWNGMNFCCNGCSTVYQILNENKLYKYYDISENPGIRIETTEFGNKYAFLEKEEIRDKVIGFSEGGISRVKFYIPVIHCASCIWLLENLNRLNSAVKQSYVNFTKKEVDLTFDENRISLRRLVELLASLHYIPDLSFNLSEKKDSEKSNRKLLYKIGVAGFAFINVMTYSLPAYFNGEPLEENLQRLFALLSYFLVIPVVFYSGSDYYLAAVKNLRKGNVSIDLPIALGIMVLFFVSSYEILLSRGVGYCDSLSGLIFFLLVGKWYQGKTYEALSFDRNYKSYFPIAVTKINRQIEESVLLEHLKEDDEILIRNKELIPADSFLVEGEGLIDYSFVTGESTPVRKKPGEFIYAGGRQMGGMIRIKVKKEVSQSYLTKLWNQDVSYKKPADSLKSLSDRVSKYFTLIVISIALLGLIYWLLQGETGKAIFVFTAVLIVACPCALALSIPFTFGNTMRIFGKKGLYIKNTDVIERLSHVDTIVFDKTGTLTRPNESDIEYSGEELSKEEKAAVYSLARQSTHPLSIAVSELFSEEQYTAPEHVVEVSGRGVFGRISDLDVKIGAREYVCGRGESGSSGQTLVYVSVNEICKGYFLIGNQYRDGVSDVIKGLKDNFDLYLLSGDNDAEKDRLREFFSGEKMFFLQKPDDKAGFISKLQQKGRRVLMTGDGLNDAGALMQSDVALTVANKVYHFSPASDAVMEAAKFGSFASFVRFTKTSLSIVKWSFFISFLYNVVGISFAITGNLSPIVAAILMPVSSVSVVAFATFVTRLMGRVRFRNQT